MAAQTGVLEGALGSYWLRTPRHPADSPSTPLEPDDRNSHRPHPRSTELHGRPQRDLGYRGRGTFSDEFV
jgi:hypothetical protein